MTETEEQQTTAIDELGSPLSVESSVAIDSLTNYFRSKGSAMTLLPLAPDNVLRTERGLFTATFIMLIAPFTSALID